MYRRPVDDVDEYLEKMQARLPDGRWIPYSPLSTAEQRKVIRLAIEARREAERLRLALRTETARVADLLERPDSAAR